MKQFYFSTLFLLCILEAYSQPGKACSTATVMNVPDTMWEYCSYTQQGMVYQGAFTHDSTYAMGAWYKFTVPAGKGITACVVDFPVYVACSTYQSFGSGVAIYKVANCDSLISLTYHGGGSYCYDGGFGNGIASMWYSPAYFDSLVEGESYYLQLGMASQPAVSVNVGIKWMPYFKYEFECTDADTIYGSPVKKCNLDEIAQMRYIPPPQWQPYDPSGSQCQSGGYTFGGVYNPVYYTIIPLADTFTVSLTPPSTGFQSAVQMFVFKDCAHLGDYSRDSTTGHYKYYYGCAANPNNFTLHVSNATAGVPLTLVMDAATGCGDILFCPYWDVFNITSSGIVMPLKLISFTASYNRVLNNAELKWKAEVINGEFTVEKSEDGISFKAIGKVQSHHDGGSRDYLFTDNNLSEGKSYYRLKMVDNDGKPSYSRMALIDVKDEKISVYPNPARDHINILYGSGTKKKVQLMLINSLGVKVLSKEMEVKAGDNFIHLDVSALRGGVYYLKMDTETDHIIRRVVVE